MIRKIILLLILLSSISFNAVLADFDADVHYMMHDELERSYYLYVPDTEVSQLLVVLHPSGSNGRAMQIVTGLNELADRHGFAIVYPDASDYFWDDGRVAAGLLPDFGEQDDVGFITTLAETLKEDLSIESAYLTGFENGGTMAYRIACESPEIFEAIIPVSAMMWDYHVENCAEVNAPVNILMMTGAEHPQYIPEGEDLEYLSSGNIFAWLGWQDTVDIWRERNNCPDSEALVTENDLTIYSDCDENSSVSFFAIPNAGYTWARMAENTINRFGVDASEIISAYISGNDWQSQTVPESASTELARSWIVYVPTTYDDNSPTPLVLNLHGRLSNAPSQAYTSDFNRIAEEEGIIVLYPNGIDTQWNYMRDIFRQEHDDEEFIRNLINDLDIDLNIDRNRMYVTGLSNGGFMTQRLACTMQDEFTAFASVAATAPYALDYHCEDALPVPIMYIHGTDDPIVKWSGNLANAEGGMSYYISYPMIDSFNFWAYHNDCEAGEESETLPTVDPETISLVIRLTNCAPNSTVILYGVTGGGHVWHGTRNPEVEFLGQNSEDFDSSEIIWEFFSQYSLNQRTQN